MRIAQACDRCRSKKIRCDGISPSCTQCTQVGFDCKTSDKLSRRAFPRGYTESLEDRVRSLENEIKELKDLLDAKDEKIDMLSRLRSSSPCFVRRRSSAHAYSESSDAAADLQSSGLVDLDNDTDTAYLTGTSSTQFLIESFSRMAPVSVRVQPLDFRAKQKLRAAGLPPRSSAFWQAPPRISSDQMVNVFFQEWAPLLPVLHRPSFLSVYDSYVSDTHSVTDNRHLAQLHLVFGIAAQSSAGRIPYDAAANERQWLALMQSFASEVSVSHLQCLALAQLYCIQKQDVDSLLRYKSQAVGLVARLGLCQSQLQFNLDALATETRKKLFWVQYCLDSFTAASLGLARQFRDDEIGCEYPVDVDDEYISKDGFQSTLPGEYTKLSNALALFKASRILAKTLDSLYTPGAHQTQATVHGLEDELDDWFQHLPGHLKLSFEKDRPSTNVISSRCPLMSLTYHYIRLLLQRPGVCSAVQSSAAVLATATSSKCIVQIVELLDERGLSFSHCISRDELLIAAGFGLCFHRLTLPTESKLLRDNQRSICTVVDLLQQSSSAVEFKRVACSVLSASSLHRLSIQPDRRLTSESLQASLTSVIKTGHAVDAVNIRRDTPREETVHERARRLLQANLQARQHSRRGLLSPSPSASLETDPDSFAVETPAASNLNLDTSLNLDFFTFSSAHAPAQDSQEWQSLLASCAASLSHFASTPAAAYTGSSDSTLTPLSSCFDLTKETAQRKSVRSSVSSGVLKHSPPAWTPSSSSSGIVASLAAASDYGISGPVDGPLGSAEEEAAIFGDDGFASLDFAALEYSSMSPFSSSI